MVLLLGMLLVPGLACSSSGEETTSPPSAPTLISPTNGAKVDGTSITFTWQGTPGATAYFLRVSNSTYPDLDDETSFFSADVGNFPQYTVSGFPDDGTEYVWGVYAGNAAGWCDKSEVLANRRSFTIEQGSSLPSAPTLIKPNNGSTVYGTSVTFQWEPVDGATGYILTVNTMNDPLSYQTRKFYDVLGDVTTYMDTGYFEDGTTYYWWVWATDAAGQSRWPEVMANGRNFISRY